MQGAGIVVVDNMSNISVAIKKAGDIQWGGGGGGGGCSRGIYLGNGFIISNFLICCLVTHE